MNTYFQLPIQAIPCAATVNKLTRYTGRVVLFDTTAITTIPNIKYQQPVQPVQPVQNYKMVHPTFDKKGLPIFAPLIFMK